MTLKIYSESNARIDLAAAHRWAALQKFDEGICNHFTLMLPGSDDKFLVIPYGLHWAEVKASDFLVVDFKGHVLSGHGEPESSAFHIHSPMHRLHSKARCILHTHMPYATSMTYLEDMSLQPIGQTALGLIPLISYDYEYLSLAFDAVEGERLAGKLEAQKSILFLANHGVIVTGVSVASAIDQLYYVERACQAQLYAYSSARPLRQVPKNIMEKTFSQFASAGTQGGDKPYELHFQAIKRSLDRTDPSYRD